MVIEALFNGEKSIQQGRTFGRKLRHLSYFEAGDITKVEVEV